MRHVFLVITLLLYFTTDGRACINSYYYAVDKTGGLHNVDEESGFHMFKGGFDNSTVKYEMQGLLQQLIVNRSYMVLSDYAIGLMRAGKNKEALEIFQVLYAEYPGEYQLASNLGTAFELNGQNDSALKYIKRGMELNPAEHGGSEWIHVKILEAKIKLAADPGYLKTHRVLVLNEEQLMDTVIAAQIELQLRERFPFCPGPDAIMAQLITDLADITMNKSVELARGFYEIGIEYFGDTTEVLRKKFEVCGELLKKYKTVHPGGDDRRVLPLSYENYIRYSMSGKMDWTGLPTDPKALLAYVDLSMSVNEAYEILRQSIPESKSPEGGINADSNGHEEPPAHEGIMISFVLVFMAILIYAFALRD